MHVKKQHLDLDLEQQTDPKLGKEYVMSMYCHPAYLIYIQSTSYKMFRLHEAQVGIKILGDLSIKPNKTAVVKEKQGEDL